MDILVPLVVFGVFGAVIIAVLAQRCRPGEGVWVMRVLLLAFALRLATSTMFATIPSTRMFHEDAGGYEAIGMAMAAGWKGEGPPLHESKRLQQNYGFYYVCGATYFLLGASRPAPTYLNSLLGTIIVFLVYRLARRFFHLRVARRAALLAAFIPSMILWSSIAIKDTAMTFLIVICLSSCIDLKRRISITAVLGTVLPIIAVQPIRFYMVYFLSAAVLASLFFERGVRAVSGFYKQLLIAGFVVMMLVFGGFAGRAEKGAEFLSLERVSNFRQGMATTADSGFAAEADISTPTRALAYLPFGMTMLLLSPFPWQFTSLRASFAAPEMILWWLLIPSLIGGIRFAVRNRFAQISPVLLFALLLTVAYSFTHGNVGSGFRQRAQIFVFFFIFTSLGQFRSLCRRRGIDEQLLINDEDEAPAAPAAAEAQTAVASASAG